MRISTTQENLHQGLSLVSRITSKNINLPILQNVLLKTNDKVIKFSTTNLEVAISCLVRGKVEEEGEFTVPARLLSDYIAFLPSGKVDLELKDTILTVKSGVSETKINGIPATEFPVIPRVNEGNVYKIPSEALQKALSSVIFAVAQTEARPELTGVFFSLQNEEGKEGKLVLAATDSYRLGEVVIPFKESSKTNNQIIVPAKTVMEILRILSIPKDIIETTQDAILTVSQNQIQFEINNIEMQSRIIDGNYPDYRQIIPNQFKTEAIVSKAAFISAIKAASLFTKTGLSDVRLEFKAGNPVTIHTADSQTGEHYAEIPGEVKGDDNYVVVNYKYLLDGLGAIRDDEVIFKIIDASNPCLLVPQDEKECYFYIVMPIKQ